MKKFVKPAIIALGIYVVIMLSTLVFHRFKKAPQLSPQILPEATATVVPTSIPTPIPTPVPTEAPIKRPTKVLLDVPGFGTLSCDEKSVNDVSLKASAYQRTYENVISYSTGSFVAPGALEILVDIRDESYSNARESIQKNCLN